MEQWIIIREFPDYDVSDQGRVRNGQTGRIMKTRVNNQGYITVGLLKDNKQHTRSVTKLVADAWLETPRNPEIFDTVIHRDGDRENARATNLMWRPRWYAIKYHKQFEYFRFHRKLTPMGFTVPVKDLDTGEWFDNSSFCAIHYGLLETEVVLSITNQRPVTMTGQEFALA